MFLYADPVRTCSFCSPSAFLVGRLAFTPASSASASVRDLLFTSKYGLSSQSACCAPLASFEGNISPLPDSHSPIPKPLPQPLIVKSRRMKHTPVIPNRQIILVLPLQPSLQIMTIRDNTQQLLQHLLTLISMQLVNLFRKRTKRENALPSRNRIRPNNGMHSSETAADVGGGSARAFMNLYFVGICVGGTEEAVAREGSCQTL